MGEIREGWEASPPLGRFYVSNKMPGEDANAIIYNSLYRHSVDEKRRVPIPFRWRPRSIEFTVVLWTQHRVGACLRVLPPDKFAKLMADIAAMPVSDPGRSVLRRQIGSNSTQAKVDSAGRITILEDMAAEAKITNQAVLVGLLDRFEIWNPERYAEVQNEDKAMLPQAMMMMD